MALQQRGQGEMALQQNPLALFYRNMTVCPWGCGTVCAGARLLVEVCASCMTYTRCEQALALAALIRLPYIEVWAKAWIRACLDVCERQHCCPVQTAAAALQPLAPLAAVLWQGRLQLPPLPAQLAYQSCKLDACNQLPGCNTALRTASKQTLPGRPACMALQSGPGAAQQHASSSQGRSAGATPEASPRVWPGTFTHLHRQPSQARGWSGCRGSSSRAV